MDAPPVHYVTSNDGYSIAYAVSGEGLPFVILPGAFEHIQLAWEYPQLQPWLEGLAARFLLVQLDERGTGMSSRGLREDHVIEHYQLDLEAVVDRLNLPPFVLYASTWPRVSPAVRFTLDHPERVLALVLGVTLTRSSGAALFKTLPAEDWGLFLRSLASLSQGPEDMAKSIDLLNQAFDKHDLVLRHKAAGAAQVDPESLSLLSRLRTPTLVLHPRHHALSEASDSMHAAQMANGTLKIIDGAFALGNAEQGIRAIEAFLASLPPLESARRQHPGTGLSDREMEVLHLLAAGRSNQEIADELVISLNTVRRHVSNIFDKTGVSNRAQATAFAKDHGVA